MSKYKVGFMVDSTANAFSENKEVIDLVDDWGYEEEEAKEIFENKEKLREVFEEWMWETIDFGYFSLKTDEEVEKFKKD